VKQKISLSVDLTILLPAGLSVHDYVPVAPPPPPPKAPAPHVELPVPIYWPPGFGQHKLTSTVKHQGVTIAQQDHDCGILIPHVSVPPVPLNIMLALIIPFSSRKFAFSAGTVKLDGAAAAVGVLSSLPVPMIACGDPVSLPIAFPVTNAANTVHVGMDGKDLVIGAINLAGSMVADALCDKASGDGPFSFGKELLSKLLGGNLGQILIKNGIGIVTGALEAVIRGEGDVDVVSFGSPFGEVKVTVSVSKERQVKVGAGAGGVTVTPGGPAKVEGKAEGVVYGPGQAGPTASASAEGPAGDRTEVSSGPLSPEQGLGGPLLGEEER